MLGAGINMLGAFDTYELVPLHFAGILIFVMMKEREFRIAIVKCPFQKVVSQVKASVVIGTVFKINYN
uniref:Uncharacterized protein n=1 Tax=Glossina pallidipes TaxID=7398 RepID=A0A1A9ZVW6_GLOPL